MFDSGSDDGTHFIVTELVEGETLADRLRRDGPMPPAEAVAVAVDIARALAAAHERGLIHRDIKPGNVMLLPDGRVKVVDFGIARAAGSDTLTDTGVVLGSTAYLSPEQAGGQPVDERADLYALGCVLYEMLTGHVPFSADTPIATMYRHVNEDAPPPSTIAPVQPELEDDRDAVPREGPEAPVRVGRRARGRPARRPARAGGRHDAARDRGASAAETQPVAVVGRGAVPPIEPTSRPTEPVAAGAVGGGGSVASDRAVARSPRRTPRGHRPWLIAALGGRAGRSP